MSQYNALKAIIRKGNKTRQPTTLIEYLYKGLAEIYTEQTARDIYFLCLYYGLIKHSTSNEALTLESIGNTQDPTLSRERIRQIIDSTIKKAQMFFLIENNLDKNFLNPFIYSDKLFKKNLATSDTLFLPIEELLEDNFFKGFSKNHKGFIAFCNDCGIKQIAYRKRYYLYPNHIPRKEIVIIIQQSNKLIRREGTIEKMNQKAKTVTYVPTEVRKHLLDFASINKYNLNPLYEEILLDFIKQKPYMAANFTFSKTQSWKARMGKAEWQQIGIYIKKDVFETIQNAVNEAQNYAFRKISLMSFICQAFIWHSQQFQKTELN